MSGQTLRVGFVGLGKMGWPMARNLVDAGFDLVVRDAAEEVQERFASEHACAGAQSPEDFADAGAVVTMLPDDVAVREAMLEWSGGIASALDVGAVLLDMSSSNPTGTKRLAGDLAADGIAVVDAPVSGGVERAKTGTLSLMIGGDDEDALARVEPILRCLGDGLFRTGPLGSGHAMKALNNFVGGATYAITVEALAVGEQFGLDPRTMIEVMNASSGRSFNTEHVVKDHVLTGAYATGFAAGLLAKDIGIAASLAEAADVDAPMCRLAAERWADAASGLGFAADHSEAHKRWWSSALSEHDARAAR